jgi:adenylylsulfate kinase-like enzyme
MIIWITGKKNSGKTTLARKLAKQLHAHVIDGDEVRAEMGNCDFSFDGISTNLNAITTMAANAHYSGRNVVIACVSPNAELRKKYQAMLPNCIEIELNGGEMWPGTTYEPTKY